MIKNFKQFINEGISLSNVMDESDDKKGDEKALLKAIKHVGASNAKGVEYCGEISDEFEENFKKASSFTAELDFIGDEAEVALGSVNGINVFTISDGESEWGYTNKKDFKALEKSVEIDVD